MFVCYHGEKKTLIDFRDMLNFGFMMTDISENAR